MSLDAGDHIRVLTGLTIWDGTRQLTGVDAMILEGGKIRTLCGSDALSATDTRRARDFTGCWAMPGLIDAHVHMVLDPARSTTPAPGERADPEAMAQRAASMVRAGITSARDLGGGAWQELALRDAIDRGELPGPRLLCAGQPVTSRGGHCHFWGGEADDATAAGEVIERQVARGVDLIKVMATGGRFTAGSAPLSPQFDLDTLTRIVSNAARHGLPVAAHCHGTPGIEAAALAGVHSIEHCSWVGPGGWASDYRGEVTAIMAEKGIWVSPTINAGWQRMIDNRTPSLPRMNRALSAMRVAGVPIMASTDAGIPGVYHHQLPQALAVFARVAGMSSEQTLRSATSDAALGLGIGDLTGRLAAGLDADLLILDGNPMADLTALARPVAVWARGRSVL